MPERSRSSVPGLSRWILARLCHEDFFSLAALNGRVAELLAVLLSCADAVSSSGTSLRLIVSVSDRLMRCAWMV